MHAHFLVVAGLVSTAVASGVFDKRADEIFRRKAANDVGVIEYDRGNEHVVVLPLQLGKNGSKETQGKGNSTEAALTPRSVLDVLLNRRQLTCEAGYGYCSNLGGCCPDTDKCCQYGYCLRPTTVCCPNSSCRSGTYCCGQNHCHPVGSECCFDESYCDAGNHCYTWPGVTGAVCCTDSSCTAYVDDGTTVTRTSSTTRPSTTRTPTTSTSDETITAPPETTFTNVEYSAYYFTVTYYYYYYYWYIIDVTRSVVTSSRTYDYSILTVSASDANDATSSFAAVTATFSPSTPAAATSLESLAGSTAGSSAPSETSSPPPSTTAPEPTTSSTTAPAPTSTADGEDAGEFTFGSGEDSSSASTVSFSVPTSLPPELTASGVGSSETSETAATSEASETSAVQASGARGRDVKFASDRVLGWWLGLAVATGLMMVAL